MRRTGVLVAFNEKYIRIEVCIVCSIFTIKGELRLYAFFCLCLTYIYKVREAQWRSGRASDSRARDCRLDPQVAVLCP